MIRLTARGAYVIVALSYIVAFVIVAIWTWER